jgi:toxin ParE1/3/4
MIVRYALRAEADLIDIATYIAERSPSGARRVGESLRRTIGLIAEHPEAGRRVGDGLFMRSVADYPYKMFYRRLADAVVIVHVRHASRRPWI